MKHASNQYQQGYIALLAVLVVGAASTAIALGLLLTGTDSQRVNLVVRRTAQARQLAHACAEEALQALHADNSLTGTASLSLSSGTCTYTVVNTGGQTRRVDASSNVNSIIQRVRVNVTIGSLNISITSWQEVAIF